MFFPSTIVLILSSFFSSSEGFTPLISYSNNNKISSFLLSSSSQGDVTKNNKEKEQEQKTYTVNISFENKTTTITVNEKETILSALERNKASSLSSSKSQNHSDNDNGNLYLSSLSSLPQECRRGNCLTCAAIHLPQSDRDSVVTADDGLTPIVRDVVDQKGYVQTCSSYVVGDNVWLELGVCHDVWDTIWGTNCNSNGVDGERIRNEAMAKCIRKADENNLVRWAMKTERTLKQ